MEKRCRTNEEDGRPVNEPYLLDCADLILPWLDPTELGSVSSTCKTLNQISKSITAARSSDASRSFENLPIPFLNAAVDHQPYFYFIYTPTQTHLGLDPSSLVRQPWGSNPSIRPDPHQNLPDPFRGWVSDSSCGCECENERCDGEDSGCPCWVPNSSELTRECGPSCQCELGCGNRLTQRGVSVGLKIVRDRRKGWGLHADQLIRCGQFVCEYAGELLTTKEARRRHQTYDKFALGGRFSSALLVVREHLPSGKACLRINIDATRIGNVARFINHSCDGGNLLTTLVRSSGSFLPRLCFFASRDIQKNEELTFSYGDVTIRPKGLKCFCGSSGCLGMLPSEHT